MPSIKLCVRKAVPFGRASVITANLVAIAGLSFVASPEGYTKVQAWRDSHVVVSIDTAKGIRDRARMLTSDDFESIKCLAVNSYHEARGEGQQGMEAVDDVVLNRAQGRRIESPEGQSEVSSYPDGVCQVIYQSLRDRDGKPVRDRCQFSWYCDGKRHEINDQSAYEEAYQIAYNKYVYRRYGLMPDKTQGATHYHNDQVHPGWKFTRLLQLGHHIFYR